MSDTAGTVAEYVFFGLFAIAFASPIWATWSRKRAARRLGVQAGLSQQDAADVTALTDGNATYLPASLQPAAGNGPATLVRARSAESRLRELTQLKDAGLISQQEYDAQRTVIVGGI